MGIKGKLSVIGQVTLFGFALLYLLSAVLRFYKEIKSDEYHSSVKNTALISLFPDKPSLVFKDATLANVPMFGVVAEREALILPVIFLLGLFLVYPLQQFLQYISPSCKNPFLLLIKVLPNAP